MDRPRVLVVEDRPSVLQLLVTILEGGNDVTPASSGAAALALLETRAFDVVLTDIRMPGASGFDLLRAVQGRDAATAVVLMTAYANVPDAVAAIKLGAFEYVAKPVEADEVALVVARAAEHARARTVGASPPGAAAAAGGIDVSRAFHEAVEDARERTSRAYLVALMRAFHGNVTCAALRAGMTRESLHRVLRKYGVQSGPYKGLAADGLGAAQE